jgi:hypothetical protein
VNKARELLQHRIHLLLVDPFPPTKRDPHGLHAAVFAEVEDDPYQLAPETPLSLISYECDTTVRTYIEPLAAGDELPDMPVFLYGKKEIRALGI